MKFGSVCSGIEAASVAWKQLGWEAAWFSEIEPFPCAVLNHHYPLTPNIGDMNNIISLLKAQVIEAPDVFCGGTPCQAFSVAGNRQSLDDSRGNLSLTFCEIANAIDEQRVQPCIVFWENVPGVLNTKDNAFGCFLAGLAGEIRALEPSGGKWTNAGYVFGSKRTVAWRVLDAQYFGVAQRRRRVFVVASARADFDPAEVLFEFESLRRDIAPSREKREEVAKCITRGIAQRYDPETETMISTYSTPAIGNIKPAVLHPIGFTRCDHGGDAVVDGTPTMRCGSNYSAHLAASMPNMAVRRLTPIECERLQGFPDGYTNIPWRGKPESPDGPRYKALGNSWAVPVITWIGKRIAQAVSTSR